MSATFAKKAVFNSPALSAALVYYQPGVVQPAHAHDYHQLSFVLCGELLEQGAGARQSREVLLPSVGVKPAGFVHANTYGRRGTLLFALSIHAAQLEGVDLARWSWQVTAQTAWRAQLQRTVRVLVQGRSGDVEGGISDLLALGTMPDASPAPARRRPDRLTRVCSALRDDETLSLQAIAADCGVHPVYLSRMFRQHMGCTPSVYRASCRLARGLQGLIDKRLSAVEAAALAGFADQSHFTREARRLSGLTPGQLQHLLTRAG